MEPVVTISGNKEDLDMAYHFCKGMLHSVFGHEKGEELFRSMPMFVGVALYVWAMSNIAEA